MSETDKAPNTETALVERHDTPAPVQPVSAFSSMAAFQDVQRMAQLLAASKLVPKEYQGDIANCVIAMEMANRIGTSPLPVMQSLVIVHGRPTWAAQWIIGAINSTGKFSPLRFEISEPDPETTDVEYIYTEWSGGNKKRKVGKERIHNRTCRAWCIEHATGTRLQSTEISIKMAVEEGWYSKDGSKWKTMPEQMLQYRAAAFFGRLYAPEILLGMPTADEVRDTADLNTIDAEGNVVQDVTTTSALNEQIRTAPKKTRRKKTAKPDPTADQSKDTGELNKQHGDEHTPAQAETKDAEAPATHNPDESLRALSRCRNQMHECKTMDEVDLVMDEFRGQITNGVHQKLALEEYTKIEAKLAE